MAKVSKDFMEYLRGTVTETGANTFSQVTINTPVGRANQLAMLIHEIVMELDPTNSIDALADNDGINMQVTKDSETNLVGVDSESHIASHDQTFKLVTSGATTFDRRKTKIFNPPLLYAKSKMFFSAVSAGQAAAKTYNVKIGYTIEKVDKTSFIEALVD